MSEMIGSQIPKGRDGTVEYTMDIAVDCLRMYAVCSWIEFHPEGILYILLCQIKVLHNLHYYVAAFLLHLELSYQA